MGDQENGNHRLSGVFGNHFRKKEKDSVRFLLHNTAGIGYCSEHRSYESLKLEKLGKVIKEKGVDVVGLTEHNQRLHVLNQENTMAAAIRPWRDHSKLIGSYNHHDSGTNKTLAGGTFTIVFGQITFRIGETGVDTRQMGRWSWMILNGKRGVATVVITAYCPCVNNKGVTSVWSQQLYAMDNFDDIPEGIIEPRTLFWLELGQLIDDFHSKGLNVILMGDFNSEFEQVCGWMVEHGLVEGICEMHGYHTAPRTQQRSKKIPSIGLFFDLCCVRDAWLPHCSSYTTKVKE